MHYDLLMYCYDLQLMKYLILYSEQTCYGEYTVFLVNHTLASLIYNNRPTSNVVLKVCCVAVRTVRVSKSIANDLMEHSDSVDVNIYFMITLPAFSLKYQFNMCIYKDLSVPVFD